MFRNDRLFAVVIAALAAMFLFAPAKASTISPPVCTPNAPELMAAVPEDNVRHVVMSLPVAGVKKGDVFIVSGELSETNDTDQWAMWGAGITVSDTATGNTGYQVTEQNAMNFNPVPSSCWGRCDVHHLVFTKVQFWVAPKDYPTAYFNFLSWSTTSPNKPSYAVTVDKGNGKMCVLHITP